MPLQAAPKDREAPRPRGGSGRLACLYVSASLSKWSASQCQFEVDHRRPAALPWVLDISAAARAVLLLPALARAVLLLLQRRPQTGRSAGPIPHSNPQCRRAPRTACSICDSASLSQPRPRQWKARTSARSEVSCMRCRRPRRTGCTPSNPALIGGTSASVRCQSRRYARLQSSRRARQSAGW